MVDTDDLIYIVESMHDNFWGGWPTEDEMAAFLAGLRIGEWDGSDIETLNKRWKRNARAVERRLADDGVIMDLSRV